MSDIIMTEQQPANADATKSEYKGPRPLPAGVPDYTHPSAVNWMTHLEANNTGEQLVALADFKVWAAKPENAANALKYGAEGYISFRKKAYHQDRIKKLNKKAATIGGV